MRGLLKVSFKDFCNTCLRGKLDKESFKSKNIISIESPLELLNIDLFGPTRTTSMSSKRYRLVVVDKFSKWTLVLFVVHKDQAFD